MSAENVEVVKEIYRGAGTAGWRMFSEKYMDPEIEWVNPPDAIETGTRKGLDEFRAALGRVGDAFSGMSVQVERFVDAGDDEVVVLARFATTGRGSGLQQVQEQGYVWTLREGKAVRYRWFNSHRAALEAAGVEEEPEGAGPEVS